MTTLYIVASLVIILLIAVVVIYNKGSKAGGNQVVVETQKGALDAVEKAQTAEHAVKSGSDPGWSERVRKLGRRP